jgi:hypothetical protein
VVAALAANPILFKIYDLSSIKDIVLGAAACSESVTQKIYELQPRWRLLVGYGKVLPRSEDLVEMTMLIDP